VAKLLVDTQSTVGAGDQLGTNLAEAPIDLDDLAALTEPEDEEDEAA